MPCGGTNMRKKAGVFFAEGAGGFGLAKVFEVRGEGGQVAYLGEAAVECLQPCACRQGAQIGYRGVAAVEVL